MAHAKSNTKKGMFYKIFGITPTEILTKTKKKFGKGDERLTMMIYPSRRTVDDIDILIEQFKILGRATPKCAWDEMLQFMIGTAADIMTMYNHDSELREKYNFVFDFNENAVVGVSLYHNSSYRNNGVELYDRVPVNMYMHFPYGTQGEYKEIIKAYDVFFDELLKHLPTKL